MKERINREIFSIYSKRKQNKYISTNPSALNCKIQLFTIPCQINEINGKKNMVSFVM